MLPTERDRLSAHWKAILAGAYELTEAEVARDAERVHQWIGPDHVLIDGDRIPHGLPCGATAVVGGDARCISIAAASIVAKVLRDRAMTRLALRYPGFGWETNVGYGTEQHTQGLARLGPCRHHRLSFAPCAQFVLSL